MVLKKEVSRTFFDEPFLGFPKSWGACHLFSVLFSSLISAIVGTHAHRRLRWL
jgi:hypothetical protein